MDIGSELRQAREARGLTIDALAAITRIQPRVLVGLERNDLSAIPPRPYARGFVATYAREVGLDPDRTVQTYFAQFESDTPRPSVPPAVPLPSDSRRRPVVATAAVLALAIAAVVMFWQPDAAAPPPASRTVGTSGTADPAATTQPEGPPPSPAAVRDESEIVVMLQTERAVWIAATTDGVRVLYRTIPPGTTETLRAQEAITLRVGDAGAVRLSVNGGPAEPMGPSGRIRDITLTPATVR
jgi:cytoskeletal protein RodZ